MHCKDGTSLTVLRGVAARERVAVLEWHLARVRVGVGVGVGVRVRVGVKVRVRVRVRVIGLG